MKNSSYWQTNEKSFSKLDPNNTLDSIICLGTDSKFGLKEQPKYKNQQRSKKRIKICLVKHRIKILYRREHHRQNTKFVLCHFL